MSIGVAAAIREHLKGLPPGRIVSPAEVARAIGCQNRHRVNNVFCEFAKRGEVVNVGYGKYRYQGIKQLREGTAKVKPRLLRAMYLKRTFTTREVAMLADAKIDYSVKVIIKLIKAGEIEKTGERQGMRGQFEGVYRVKDRDAFFLAHLSPGAEGTGK